MMKKILSSCWMLLAGAVLTASPVAAKSVSATGAPVALVLEGQSSLDFERPGTLDLGPSGTIEFQVAALWDEEPDYLPCVLAIRRPATSEEPAALEQSMRVSIHIGTDRSEIGMWNGRRWDFVPFDFSDGEFHHVALVTDGDETEVVIDGESQAVLDFGYGTGTGLPLHIGSSDGASDFFYGSVRQVRLWDDALPVETLAELASVTGVPKDAAADLLIAYSDFASPKQKLVFLAGDAGVKGRGLKELRAKAQQAKEKNKQKRAERADARQSKKRERNLARKDRRQEKVGFTVDPAPEFDYGDPAPPRRRPPPPQGAPPQAADAAADNATDAPDAATAARRRQQRAGANAGAGDVAQELGVRSRARIVAPSVWRKRPKAEGEPLTDGDVINVGRLGLKKLAIAKTMTSGANGDVFLVEDRAGRKSVLKQQKLLAKDGSGESGPIKKYPEYQTRRAKYIQDNPGLEAPELLEPIDLMRKGAKHEVDMQNLASTALKRLGGDEANLVDPAELVGTGRIRQKFAGPSFTDLLQDMEGETPEMRQEVARVMLKKMLTAAAALESAGMVHRDLHFGNVAVDETGQLKVLDFGLTKRAADQDVRLEMESGIGVGGEYGANMAPETYRAMINGRADFASTSKADVFSVGYEFQKYQGLSQLPPFGAGMKAVVDELVSDNPGDRPTARDALARLETADKFLESQAENLVAAAARRRVASAVPAPAAGPPRPPRPSAGLGAIEQAVGLDGVN